MITRTVWNVAVMNGYCWCGGPDWDSLAYPHIACTCRDKIAAAVAASHLPPE